MTHTLTIVEPIWPMLQNVSKTLTYGYISKPTVIHKQKLHSFLQILLFLSGCLEGSHKDGEAFSFLLTSLLDRLNMSLCEVTTMMNRSNQSEVLLLLLRFFNIIMSRKRMKGDRSEVIDCIWLFTVYNVQCQVYNVQCTMYTVHCTVYSV